MPRNASGTYTLPTGNPVVTGTVIESTWANDTMSDLASAITNSLARDGAGGMTAALRVVDGSVSVPGLGFANETGSGLYRAAAGDVGLTILGNQILRMRSTGLDVTGALGVSGATTLAAASATNLSYTGTLTGGTGVINIGSGQVYKDASGNVGIGTSSPTSYVAGYTTLQVNNNTTGGVLEVSNSTTVRANFFASSGGTSELGTITSHPMVFKTVNAERMRITADGRVGIGTNSPANMLTIASTTSTFPSGIRLDRGLASVNAPGNYPASDYGIMQFAQNSGGGGSFFRWLDIVSNGGAGSSDGIIRFFTNSSTAAAFERMRIDGSGNLLVGTTSSGGTNGLSIVPLAAGAGSCAAAIWNKTNTGSETAAAFRVSGNQIGSITYTNTGTAFNTTSDYRLKENVEPMTGALATVAALKPVTYTWKVDGSAGQGFIAHELQAVVPDCVTGEKDAVRTVDVTDEDGKVIGNKQEPVYQGVDTSFLVATLTAAIQELKAEVDALKAAAA